MKKLNKEAAASLSVYILLDRSASMADNSRWPQAVKATNAYVAELALSSPNAEITLVLFDSPKNGMEFVIVRDQVKAKDWEDFGESEATPRGNTPLYDATAAIAGMALSQGGQRTAIVIWTDGEETSSKDFSKNEANILLNKCRSRGWQVVFLGADFNVEKQATDLGSARGQTISMTPKNFRHTMATMAGYTQSYAATGAAMAFSDQDRAAAAK